MEKFDLSLKSKDLLVFDFQKQTIEVNPYFSLETKVLLARNYIDCLFRDEDIVANYLIAENGLICGILDRQTNINVDVKGFDIDAVVASGLWEEILKGLNLNGLRQDIGKIIEYRKGKYSLDSMIEKTLEKVGGFLDAISKLNVDDIRSASRQLSEEIKDLDTKFPGAFAVKESKPKSKKAKKVVNEPKES